MNFIKRLFKYISQMFEQDDRSSYGHPTLEEMKQFRIERRKKDKVDELLLKDGFYDCRRGRDGYIYYVEDDHLCEMYWETSGVRKYDILLAPVDLRKWIRPEGMPIPLDRQLDILRKLRSWLKEQKTRSNIDPPINVELGEGRCAWKDCDQQKMQGLAYCPYHYDLNLLR